MVVHLYGPYASRCSRVEDVARLQREEAADICDDLVHLVHHLARAALLHRPSVDVHVEVNGLNVAELLLVHPFAYHSRAVELFGDGPRASQVLGLFLHVARRKVNTQRHRVVISVGKPLRNRLPQPADPHHHLGLMVDASHEVRDEKRLPVLQQRRIGLREDDRLSGLPFVRFCYQ